MVDEEKFRQLPYREQLKMPMEEARKEMDIWLMLVIDEKIREEMPRGEL